MVKKFKNLKISLKLKIMFIIIIVVFTLFMITSINTVMKITRDLHLFYNESYNITCASLESKELFESIQKTMYEIIFLSNESNKETMLNQLHEYSENFNKNFKILKNGFKGNTELVQNIETQLLESTSLRNKILEALNEDKELALYLLNTDYLPIIKSVQASLDSIVYESSQKAISFIKESKSIEIITALILTSLLIIMILYLICVYHSLIKSIVRPIEEFDKTATQVSQGNLKTQINYEYTDEIGTLIQNISYTIDIVNSYILNISKVLDQISNKNLDVKIDIEYIGDFLPIKKSMENIISSMSFTLGNIKSIAGQVSLNSENIAKASQIIADGASNQSSCVQQLVATFNSVAEQINKTTEDVKSVNEKSTTSLQFVNSGNEYMQKLLKCIDKLSSHTEEISKITKVVDDISNQINMLSLNATIEAARAGQSGKGFAVVANEIGKLANETAKSTKDISDIIDKAISDVKDGMSLSKKTNSIFKNIVYISDETDTVIENISLACTNQTSAVNEILKAIEQISDVIQSDSSTAQQTFALSEQLLSQAELVTQLLGEFKLSTN